MGKRKSHSWRTNNKKHKRPKTEPKTEPKAPVTESKPDDITPNRSAPLEWRNWFSETVVGDDRCQSCNCFVRRHATEEGYDYCDEYDEADTARCDGCRQRAWRTPGEKHLCIIGEGWEAICFDEDDGDPVEFDDAEARQLISVLDDPGCKVRGLQIKSSLLSDEVIEAMNQAMQRLRRRIH